MNMRVACPHCQVIGVVPDELRKIGSWPVLVIIVISIIYCR